MMRTLRWVLVWAMVPTLCGCSVLGDVLGRPTVESVKPRITAIGLDGVNLVFDIAVHNPYITPLNSPRFRYGLDIEERPLIQSQETAVANLPARGVGTVSLPVHLKYAEVMAIYRELSTAKQFRYKLHGAFLLTAMDRTMELPVSHQGTLPVLRAPQFSNFNVRMSDLTLRGATVTVEAEMQNPNSFAVGLGDLGYGLSLGETRVGALTAATADSIPSDGTGRITLKGRIESVSALTQLLRGGSLGKPALSATGFLDTPYGRAGLKP
jgi:LEA14-like dessication related protein